LAVFFAKHVYNITMPLAQWDWIAMAITLAACIALFRFKINTILLIVSCAIIGLVVSLLLK
jgi:chromate transporter